MTELKNYLKPLTDKNAQLVTAPTQKAGFRASFDSFVVNQTFIFQIKFCGKSPALRVAAKRYSQCYQTDSATNKRQ
jgi:hypothetical protein